MEKYFLANCRANEIFSCGSACDTTCATLGETCPIINIKCNEMCYCIRGYARDSNHMCIPIRECPRKFCQHISIIFILENDVFNFQQKYNAPLWIKFITPVQICVHLRKHANYIYLERCTIVQIPSIDHANRGVNVNRVISEVFTMEIVSEKNNVRQSCVTKQF